MAKRKIPQGVREAVTALAIEGIENKSDIARRFGLDVQTVRRMAQEVKGIDPTAVAELQRALPSLLQVLASSHAMQALEKIDDPNASVRHTFGAKLAVEAGRVAQPQAEAPGHTMLTFINQLKIQTAPAAEVIDAPPESTLAELGPIPGTSLVVSTSGPDGFPAPTPAPVESLADAVAVAPDDGWQEFDGSGSLVH